MGGDEGDNDCLDRHVADEDANPPRRLQDQRMREAPVAAIENLPEPVDRVAEVAAAGLVVRRAKQRREKGAAAPFGVMGQLGREGPTSTPSGIRRVRQVEPRERVNARPRSGLCR